MDRVRPKQPQSPTVSSREVLSVYLPPGAMHYTESQIIRNKEGCRSGWRDLFLMALAHFHFYKHGGFPSLIHMHYEPHLLVCIAGDSSQ